jgi:hypothetical protein
VKRLIAFLIAASLCLPTASSAWWKSIQQVGVSSGGGGYVGPGDIVSGASFYYGLRAYTAAYATSNGNIADIVDTATGTATCTIVAKSSGDADLTSLSCAGGTLSVTTFCTVTHTGCSVTKLYDQTGNNAGGAGQSTLALMPTLTLGATSNSKPAMTFLGSSSQIMGFALLSAIPQPYTSSSVARRTALFTTQGGIIGDGSFFIDFKNVAAAIDFFSGAADTSTPSIDGSFIAIQAVGNGASSTVKVNSSAANTVSPGTSATGTGINIGDDGFNEFLTGNIAEVIMWPSGLSSGNQSSISSNQQSYWGT